jgi:hypothetical protein
MNANDIDNILDITYFNFKFRSLLHRRLVRPTILYDSKYWVVDRRIKHSMSFLEIKMFT